MEEILTAVIPVFIIGVVCAAVLVIASKLMAVKEDERFPKIRECLPGANCGACGFAGCDGYAKALCENDKTPVNLCVPGGQAVSESLGSILGVESGEVEMKTAFVRCSGDCAHTSPKVEYHGMESCKAAKMLYGGTGSCGYGCIGFGDCMEVCPQKAISIVNGIARVDRKSCIGCGLCVRTCPNGLIALIGNKQPAAVACSSKEKGAVTRKACTAGCIGCKKCERVCPMGAVKVTDNLASVDGYKCASCPDPGLCARNCPTGCLAFLAGKNR